MTEIGLISLRVGPLMQDPTQPLTAQAYKAILGISLCGIELKHSLYSALHSSMEPSREKEP